MLILRCLAPLMVASGLLAQDTREPADASPEPVLFEQLPAVRAATLHTQTLEDAPASATVISAEEIRTYGWRTLGEVMVAARGFYMTYDRAYEYAGVRGFSRPGAQQMGFTVHVAGCAGPGRLLAGQTVRPAEGPRRLKIAVNQSVLRLFGLRSAAAGREEVMVLP